MKAIPLSGLTLAAGLAVAMSLMPAAGHAAERTWSGAGGAGNGGWNTAANWVSSNKPGNGDSVVCPSGPANTTGTNDISGLQIIGITFTGSGYSMSGNVTTLSGSGLALTNSGAGTNTLSMPLAMNGNATLGNTTSGTFNVFGDINLAANTLTVTGSNGIIALGGAISGSGTAALGKEGNHQLNLNGGSTFSGSVALNGGVTVLNQVNGLGAATAGTTIASGAELRINVEGTITEPITLAGGNGLAGDGALRLIGANSATLAGAVTLAGDTGIGVDSGAVFTISGAIGGSSGLTKLGYGVLNLSGINTYSGATTVSSGTLNVNGALPNSPITLNGGQLGGTGTVGTLTVGSGATLDPAGGSAVGKLTLATVSFASGSTFAVQIGGTTAGSQYDQLETTSAPALGSATLAVSFTGGFTPAVGNSFTLINNTSNNPVSGTFSGLTEGATFSVGSILFQISYGGGNGGNDVVITVLSVSGGGGGGGTGLAVPTAPTRYDCLPAGTPILSTTPAMARPLGLTFPGSNLQVDLVFDAFQANVDIYIAVLSPYGQWTMRNNAGAWVSFNPNSLSTAVPLRSASSAPLTMNTATSNLYNGTLAGMSGTYTAYVAVLPAGTSLSSFSFTSSSYYLWCFTHSF